jgi:hypothetical protein
MARSNKRYTTTYKKKLVETDIYIPNRSPKGVLQCKGCGAFYARAALESESARTIWK